MAGSFRNAPGKLKLRPRGLPVINFYYRPVDRFLVDLQIYRSIDKVTGQLTRLVENSFFNVEGRARKKRQMLFFSWIGYDLKRTNLLFLDHFGLVLRDF